MYEQMDGEIQAAEARAEWSGKILREQYEEKRQQGTLSQEEHARYEKILAELEESRSQPRMRYRYGEFYIEPGKAKSESIKPNQTGGISARTLNSGK